MYILAWLASSLSTWMTRRIVYRLFAKFYSFFACVSFFFILIYSSIVSLSIADYGE